MAKYKWSRVELGWWGAMWLMMLTRFVTSHQTFIIASRPCPSHVKYIFHSHAHPFSSLGRSHRRRTQQFFLLFGWWVGYTPEVRKERVIDDRSENSVLMRHEHERYIEEACV